MQKREAEKNLANLIIPTTTSYGSESSAHEHEQIPTTQKAKEVTSYVRN